jgi:hypothetical protein
MAVLIAVIAFATGVPRPADDRPHLDTLAPMRHEGV